MPYLFSHSVLILDYLFSFDLASSPAGKKAQSFMSLKGSFTFGFHGINLIVDYNLSEGECVGSL